MTRVPIEALDDRGDGVAIVNGSRRSVPFAAPGDALEIGADGSANLLASSPERARPPCPLFGHCGGCTHQHLADARYEAWKRGRLVEAFARVGLAPSVEPMVRAPLASRRRATLTARRDGKGVRVGYFARGSHAVVDVPSCPALAPRLGAALPALRDLARQALGDAQEVRMVATLCANGIDAALTRSVRRTRGRRGRDRGGPRLASDAQDVVRISLDGETLIEREAPLVSFTGVEVAFPSGAFLQASAEAEAALQQAVLAATEGARSIADCFSGLGTFALPLARRASVLAVEADGRALEALDGAARRASALRPVRTLRRDLQRHPLAVSELAAFDAVVFDPPRAGAQALARSLGASEVARVVAVSCEPSTLARDCAILVEGGYKITQVLPVDQFVATPHIEAVAVLRRT